MKVRRLPTGVRRPGDPLPEPEELVDSGITVVLVDQPIDLRVLVAEGDREPAMQRDATSLVASLIYGSRTEPIR